MELNFRKAKTTELDAAMDIIAQAQAYLAQQGVDQWQDGRPSRQTIQHDIEAGHAYLLTADGTPAGFIVVVPGQDPSYSKIYEGSWAGSEEDYAAIHRVALSANLRGSGLATTLLQHAIQVCQGMGFAAIRIDTHRQNLPMQGLLQKNGFLRRGVIYLADCGDERIAFEKTL